MGSAITRRWLLSSVSLFALTIGMEAPIFPAKAQPTAINIPNQTFQPGTQTFTMNNFVAGVNQGFDAVFTPPGNWPSGAVFDIAIQLSNDGTTFNNWIFAPQTSDGTSAEPFSVSGSWPGVNDGSGGRKILFPSAVRVTLTVHQVVQFAVSVTPR